MEKNENIFRIEKKSIYIINFVLILLVILSFLFSINIKYFFYFDLILTFFLSYFFFKRSKKLAKKLIITNLFIFFYFLYPNIAEFLYQLLGIESYIFIIFYNILISYLFLFFSDEHNKFLGNIKKTNLKFLLIIILIGIIFGFLFYFIREPIPSIFSLFINNSFFQNTIIFLLFNSFIVALSEQMIFSGFLFNTYRNLTSKSNAIIQTSFIFILFHILRLKILINYYFREFNSNFLFYLIGYYIFLFIFMITVLYFYSFKSKKYEGNFIYPVILHFITDFSLFLLYFL